MRDLSEIVVKIIGQIPNDFEKKEDLISCISEQAKRFDATTNYVVKTSCFDKVLDTLVQFLGRNENENWVQAIKKTWKGNEYQTC